MAEHFIVIFSGSIILGIIITLFTYAGEKKLREILHFGRSLSKHF